jgi:hypothetical protein
MDFGYPVFGWWRGEVTEQEGSDIRPRPFRIRPSHDDELSPG